MSSHREVGGGNGGRETGATFLVVGDKREDLLISHDCPSTGAKIRVCVKCGIVEMRGERAHGRVDDVRSCSKVGSIKLETSSS